MEPAGEFRKNAVQNGSFTPDNGLVWDGAPTLTSGIATPPKPRKLGTHTKKPWLLLAHDSAHDHIHEGRADHSILILVLGLGLGLGLGSTISPKVTRPGDPKPRRAMTKSGKPEPLELEKRVNLSPCLLRYGRSDKSCVLNERSGWHEAASGY